MTKDDQLVIPISLAVGMALRLVAEDLDITIADLAREILRVGLEGVRDEIRIPYTKKLEELKRLNKIELAKLKSKYTKPKNHIRL